MPQKQVSMPIGQYVKAWSLVDGVCSLNADYAFKYVIKGGQAPDADSPSITVQANKDFVIDKVTSSNDVLWVIGQGIPQNTVGTLMVTYGKGVFLDGSTIGGATVTTSDTIDITGTRRVDMAVSTTPVQSVALSAGIYSIQTTVNGYLRVDMTNAIGVNKTEDKPFYRRNDSNGLKIPEGARIGFVTDTGTGIFSYQKTGSL